MANHETIKRYYRVDRREIGFIKFIFEASDGIAVISTVDAHKGVVALAIPPGCEKEVNQVLNDLKKNIRIESASEYEQLINDEREISLY